MVVIHWWIVVEVEGLGSGSRYVHTGLLRLVGSGRT